MKRFTLTVLAALIISSSIPFASDFTFPDIEGWTKAGSPQVYDKDSLYNYINGAADSYIELTYKSGNSDFWETKSFGFYMKEDIFHIEVSGYVHDSTVGGDSIGYPGWYVEAEGGRDDDAILSQLEDSLAEFLDSNMKVTVEDSSNIEYDDE